MGKGSFDFQQREDHTLLKDSNQRDLDTYTGREQSIGHDIEVNDETSHRPAVQLANMIFNQAIDSRASDVHIEPFENRTRIGLELTGIA